uniref:LOB domain-containing protein n=1 Tax=Oryza meridionalis TaxID=40149 RepID=A0A0E0DQ91_9ORYZ
MGGGSPCASCKLLRRRCTKDCIFAPFFPADDPHKFAIVHKVFGASNVSKMLQELPAQQRGDAVSSLVYEANARMRDPVYGCVGAISFLQNQVSQLQMQLAVAQAEILCIQMQHRDDGAQLAGGGGGDHHHHHHQLLDQQQQQQMVVDAADAAASFLVQNGGGGGGPTPQLMSSYGAPAAGGGGGHGVVHYAAAQEHLKRESLWT